MTPEQSRILDIVIERYLQSHDFNGLPVGAAKAVGLTDADLMDLIKLRQVDLVRGDIHPNPHIKAFDAEPPEVQIEKIEKSGQDGCLYPTPELLAERKVDITGMGPYTAALSLGAPQLSFRAFDLRALEWYRNDPRFEARYKGNL